MQNIEYASFRRMKIDSIAVTLVLLVYEVIFFSPVFSKLMRYNNNDTLLVITLLLCVTLPFRILHLPSFPSTAMPSKS